MKCCCFIATHSPVLHGPSVSYLRKYVFWPFAALWGLPIDVLVGNLDIASLAVNAARCRSASLLGTR
jgi:hypothetical protein